MDRKDAIFFPNLHYFLTSQIGDSVHLLLDCSAPCITVLIKRNLFFGDLKDDMLANKLC